MGYDVIIAGGGPAGLSAAVVLGRCLRRVLVCDTGSPRNAAARGIHGFLTREGIDPSGLIRTARGEAEAYGGELRAVEVTDARVAEGGFEVALADGSREACRRLLLATGVTDVLPPMDGAAEMYGKSLWHCPYCDGWEARGLPLAVYGRGKHGSGLALALRRWSDDVVLLTNGPSGLTVGQHERLKRQGIDVLSQRIARFEARDGHLERVVFRNDSAIERRGVFFETGQRSRSKIAEGLGCRINRRGTVVTSPGGLTACEGVYAAGDLSHDAQFVVVAAAEGVKAAVAINKSLLAEETR